jgi:hypothetical protein
MTNEQVKRARTANIKRLASRGDGDYAKAERLYNRCVRFCKRWFRWGEMQANGNGHYAKWQWEAHEHEEELLHGLAVRLERELLGYDLAWEFPGLYPVLVDGNGCHHIELVWY